MARVVVEAIVQSTAQGVRLIVSVSGADDGLPRSGLAATNFDVVSVASDEDTAPRQQLIAQVAEGPAGIYQLAEGIEHAAQLSQLGALGIHAGQGYFLGRPGPLSTAALLCSSGSFWPYSTTGKTMGLIAYNHRLAIAPMMDWTDRHCRYFLRLITRRARLYTEMITAPALAFFAPCSLDDATRVLDDLTGVDVVHLVDGGHLHHGRLRRSRRSRGRRDVDHDHRGRR